MMAPWHISVIIPARNEEHLLRRCLHSVHRAVSLLPLGVTSDLIVTVDASTDRTWQIAKEELAGRGLVVCCDAGIVGKARALGADAALTRYHGPLNHCWLANTDADCVVPASWLNDQLRLAADGIEAVAGIIDVDHFDEHLPIVPERFRATYLIPADGPHPHVHGANLGVRADAYLRAGGWHTLPAHEDHDLWHRLQNAGAIRASVSSLQVLTSGRKVGRAPQGFAQALAAHNEG